jgi:protein-S-isoprenylcysteine O-methyltransferase Ste14
MSVSQSTPRLRLTAWLLIAALTLVAVSERSLCGGLAGELMQLAGLALIACAALGRIWSSAFIAGFKDTSLVQEGPYSALRHPLYALSLLAMLGIGLATRSIAITLILMTAFVAIYLRSARREDAFLARAHGRAHAEYGHRLRSFWPDFREYRVPELIEVRPRVFWKAFLDAGSLLGLYVVIRVADLMQTSGIAPTWLSLP